MKGKSSGVESCRVHGVLKVHEERGSPPIELVLNERVWSGGSDLLL